MIRKRLRLDIVVSDGLYYQRRPTEYVQRESFRHSSTGSGHGQTYTVAQPTPGTQIMDISPPKRRTTQPGVSAKAIHAVRPKRSVKLRAVQPVATPRLAAVKAETQLAPPFATPSKAPPKTRGLKQYLTRQNSLYALALLVFIIGVTASLNSFNTNRQVAAHVSGQSQKSTSDTTATAPSTSKPSAQDVSSYAVAPTMPRYIDIPKLSVHARVFSMSVDTRNQLRAPGNVHDAGWYNGSALPGQAGAMLVDGHVSSWQTHGVFYGLGTLVKGDAVTVTRGDGKQYTYVVVRNEKYDANKVDMSSLMVSDDTAKPGLNIITCAGDVKPGTSEFTDRQVVHAVLQ